MKKASLFFLLATFFTLSVFFYQKEKYSDGKFHLIFCNVGQGDGILIRTPNGSDIIVDGGPDKKILECLNSHMPFWDRTIELMILTHPHADHLNGLNFVLQRYSLKSFASEKISNKTVGYSTLVQALNQEKIPIQYIYSGQKVRLGDSLTLQVVGPTKEFLEKTSPGGTIGESEEFGSVETYIKYGNFSALLTGDSQAVELENASSDFNLNNLSVLQVPHHGSKTGLNENLVESLNPKVAVISVGKNKYGHPTQFTLELLKKSNITILQTQNVGNVEIVTDKNKWEVRH